MKKFFALLLAGVLVCAAFLVPLNASAANVPSDARFEVFDLTPADADVEWYADGRVMAVPNDGDAPLSVASGEYPLRYLFILVFDKDGVCVEVGNNLLSADDEKAAAFPQHDVTIPAKGFGVFFYYNATEGPSNVALYEYYEELGGTIYSNETGNPISGKNYVAVLENNTVTVYFASADAPEGPSDEPSNEPSEEPSETPSEEPSEEPSAETPETSDTSDASSAAAPSEGASEPSAETSVTPDTGSSSDEGESGNSNTGSIVGVIVGVIVAVLAVAAVVVGVVIAKAKKKKG